MKLHACRHCGSRLRTYTELQEHLKTHPNVCVTCYRLFSNRSNLLAHKCCGARFVNVLTVRKQNWLDIKERRHVVIHYYRKRNVKNRCHRSRTWKHHHQHWQTNTVPNFKTLLYNTGVVFEQSRGHGPVQSRYNFRLMTSDIGGLDLGHIFADQTTAFKLNVSYGFILRNKISGRYRFYHSSCNCCGRYLDEPSLITNADTFEIFLERIKEPDILKWELSQRPNSDWVVELVTITY